MIMLCQQVMPNEFRRTEIMPNIGTLMFISYRKEISIDVQNCSMAWKVPRKIREGVVKNRTIDVE